LAWLAARIYCASTNRTSGRGIDTSLAWLAARIYCASTNRTSGRGIDLESGLNAERTGPVLAVKACREDFARLLDLYTSTRPDRSV